MQWFLIFTARDTPFVTIPPPNRHHFFLKPKGWYLKTNTFCKVCRNFNTGYCKQLHKAQNGTALFKHSHLLQMTDTWLWLTGFVSEIPILSSAGD
jgi:hypothetical protein